MIIVIRASAGNGMDVHVTDTWEYKLRPALPPDKHGHLLKERRSCQSCKVPSVKNSVPPKGTIPVRFFQLWRHHPSFFRWQFTSTESRLDESSARLHRQYATLERMKDVWRRDILEVPHTWLVRDVLNQKLSLGLKSYFHS